MSIIKRAEGITKQIALELGQSVRNKTASSYLDLSFRQPIFHVNTPHTKNLCHHLQRYVIKNSTYFTASLHSWAVCDITPYYTKFFSNCSCCFLQLLKHQINTNKSLSRCQESQQKTIFLCKTIS